MPTYDYACSACGHRFERFEGIREGGPKSCPECGKRKARRRLGTGAGLIFKGSGFYTTDYRKGGSAEPAGGSKDAAAKDGDAKKPAAAEKKKEEKEPKK